MISSFAVNMFSKIIAYFFVFVKRGEKESDSFSCFLYLIEIFFSDFFRFYSAAIFT